MLALFAGAGDLTLAAYQANAENKAAGINVQFHVLACYYRESVSVVAQTRLKLKAWEDYNNCSLIVEGHTPLAKMPHGVAHSNLGACIKYALLLLTQRFTRVVITHDDDGSNPKMTLAPVPAGMDFTEDQTNQHLALISKYGIIDHTQHITIPLGIDREVTETEFHGLEAFNEKMSIALQEQHTNYTLITAVPKGAHPSHESTSLWIYNHSTTKQCNIEKRLCHCTAWLWRVQECRASSRG